MSLRGYQTIEEVVPLIGYSKATIQRWLRRGLAETAVLVSGSWFLDKKAVKALQRIAATLRSVGKKPRSKS